MVVFPCMILKCGERRLKKKVGDLVKVNEMFKFSSQANIISMTE